ncbi:hypothetical protein [Streptomyces sp. NPDC127190]|uniref:hypothetical protein n=1 Tax=unclassified Streptomyces TaxID=2593676 RepID=UPI00363CB497
MREPKIEARTSILEAALQRADRHRHGRAGEHRLPDHLVQPPVADQAIAFVRSALHQADGRAVEEVAARLTRTEGCTRQVGCLVFADATDDQGDDPEGGGDDAENVESHPSNVSLDSLLDEIAKLKQVRVLTVLTDAY